MKEAKKVLKDSGLQLNLNIENLEEINEEETKITDQTPKAGITINKGSNIYATI